MELPGVGAAGSSLPRHTPVRARPPGLPPSLLPAIYGAAIYGSTAAVNGGIATVNGGSANVRLAGWGTAGVRQGDRIEP
eukprot:2185841-Rhodomonas_salina.1